MIVIRELVLKEARISIAEGCGGAKKNWLGKCSGWDLNSKVLFSIAAHLD
jgi:hypothetical protein